MAGESPAAVLYNSNGSETGVEPNPLWTQSIGFGGQARQEFTAESYVEVNHNLDGYPLNITVLAIPVAGSTGAFGIGGFGEGGFGEAGGQPDTYLQRISDTDYSLRYVDENNFIIALSQERTGVILYEV